MNTKSIWRFATWLVGMVGVSLLSSFSMLVWVGLGSAWAEYVMLVFDGVLYASTVAAVLASAGLASGVIAAIITFVKAAGHRFLLRSVVKAAVLD